MNYNEEQGFLSGKFEDWSGEPIPNGWNQIEKKLDRKRKYRNLFWWIFPASIFIASLSYYQMHKNVGDESALGQAHHHTTAAPKNNAPSASLNEPVNSHSAPVVNGPESGRQNLESNPQAIENQASTDRSSGRGSKPQNLLATSSDTDLSPSQLSAGMKANPNPFSSRKKRLPVLHPSAHSSQGSEMGVAQSGDSEGSYGHPASTEQGSAPMGRHMPAGAGQTENTQAGTAIAYGGINAQSGVVGGENNSEVPSNESNTALPGFTSKNAQTRSHVEFLTGKSPLLNLGSTPVGSPALVETAPGLPPSALPAKHWQFFAGSSAGMAQNSIQLNQAEAVHHVKINNIGKIQSWFFQAGAGANYRFSSWLSAFSSVQLGLYNQQLSIENTAKNPSEFKMEMHDSLNYNVVPQWKHIQEKRTQQLFFVNAELGIKPLLSVPRQSGPFASVVLWTKLASINRSNVQGSVSYLSGNQNFSLGYRVGYQHRISDLFQLEAFMSSFPGGLLARTKGISISPRLIGMGLTWSLR